MNALSFENLTRTFGGRRVLDGASGRAEKGKVIGLLGRNGEGKTTLFKVLLDLLAAYSGEAEVLGLRPDGSGEIRQLAGFVPERPAFHSFMTAAEALALRASVFRNWNPGRAAALCKRLGIKFINYPNAGSPTDWITGMNQAINRKADLIILQLREKVRSLQLARQAEPGAVTGGDGAEAVSALVNLGYKPAEAERAVQGASAAGSTPLPELIRDALRRLAS